MKFTFICAEHPEFGSNGWRLESQPDFDALGGMAVAHDILEHFRKGDGSPADELQALGAALWLRDGWFPNGTGGDNVGADLPEVMSHVLFENMHLPEPPHTKPCEADQEIKKAYRTMAKEMPYREDLAPATAYRRHIIGWMRVGYRRARRRYKNICRSRLIHLFSTIMEEADRRLKHAEEGDRMEVQVVLRPKDTAPEPSLKVYLLDQYRPWED